ncbi:MAG: hypothetical protein LBQ81_05310 [Zoogloeaceae bacterium]|nr:hypothetical protein [Zoogloeaceae bacterium]
MPDTAASNASEPIATIMLYAKSPSVSPFFFFLRECARAIKKSEMDKGTIIKAMGSIRMEAAFQRKEITRVPKYDNPAVTSTASVKQKASQRVLRRDLSCCPKKSIMFS